MTALALVAVFAFAALATALPLARRRPKQALQQARADEERKNAQLRAAEAALSDVARALVAGGRVETGFPPQIRDTPLATALYRVLSGVSTAVSLGVEAARQEARGRVEQVRAIAEREQQEYVSSLRAVVADLAHRAGPARPPDVPRTHEAHDVTAGDPGARGAAAVLLAATNYAILGGSRLAPAGRPSSLADLVRTSCARAGVTERVRLAQIPEVMVRGEAVEGLTHLLAALLDNASRASATVQVACDPRPDSSAYLLVDDAGPGMTEQQLAAARGLLAETGAEVLLHLGARPQLGLRTVGALTRYLGIGTDLISPAPWGGTRVVLALPGALFAHPAPPREGGEAVGGGRRGTAEEWIAGTRRARTQETHR
ncbi:ATP-binding protein [Streptomyces sp. NPDC047046]|uniref:ATP-binding protein n=1 Tax=Streptomyces sp. NPDC047046 TaxID=3155378 RepID=UPI0033C382CE